MEENALTTPVTDEVVEQNNTVVDEGTETTQEPSTTTPTQTDSAEELIKQNAEVETQLREHLATKGVDFDAVSEEFVKFGELSTDTQKKLEEAGYPKVIIDSYIDNIKRQAEAFNNEISNVVGGEENMKSLVDYLHTQGEDKVNQVKEVLESGNIGIAKLVLKGIQSEMTAKYGTKNRTILGGDAGIQTEAQGFTTQSEMVAAMSDPRYRTDAQYRKEVELKAQRSSLF